MSRETPPEDTEGAESSSDGLTFTRRTALALMGAGGAAAAVSGSASAATGDAPPANHEDTPPGERPWREDVNAHGHDLTNLHAIETDHVFTAARDADRIVWKDEDGVFHADGPDGQVASGEDVIDVAQAAVDSLTDGRDWKEKVAIVSPATIGPHDSPHELVLDSYTILDVPTTITIEDNDPLEVIPVKARNAHHIEVHNLTLRGFPEYCMVFNSVSNLQISDINLEIDPSGPGTGIRIDGGGGERSTDIQVERIYAENVGYHVFETRAVDRVQVSDVMAKNVTGCTVLLNETADATVSDVVEYSPDPPNETRYATFRTTYQQGRVTATNIVSHEAKRGLHIHTGSGEVTINNVYIDGARHRGASLSGPPNMILNGGIIKNCSGSAIDLYNVYDPQLKPERRADGVNLTNLRIYDDREEDERDQTVAINEAPNSQNNRIVNNDVRDGGTEGLIQTASPTTVVRDNVGDGVASGTVTLTSGSDPAARVEGVSEDSDVTLDLRAKPFEAPAASFAWDHHFEYDGDDEQWDLVVQWQTDPGEDITLDYIVDRPQANIGRYPQELELSEGLEPGTYRVRPEHSGLSMEVEDGSTQSGANVVQDEWTGAEHQQWDVEAVDGEDNVFRIAAVHSGDVLQVAGASTEEGASVVVGDDEGADHQRWIVTPRGPDFYSLENVGTGYSLNVYGARSDPGENVIVWGYGGDDNSHWSFEEV